MHEVESFKILGIISITIIWLTIIYTLNNLVVNKNGTISQHAASNRRILKIYSAGAILSVALFSIFMYGWLIPHFRLNTPFFIVTTTGIVAEFLTLFIPESGDLKTKIHHVVSYGTAIMLPFITLLIAINSNVYLYSRVVNLASTVSMLILIPVVYINRKSHLQKNVLYHQCIYYALFHIGVLSAAYIR